MRPVPSSAETSMLALHAALAALSEPLCREHACKQRDVQLPSLVKVTVSFLSF